MTSTPRKTPDLEPGPALQPLRHLSRTLSPGFQLRSGCVETRPRLPRLTMDGSLTGQAGAIVPGTGDPFNGMVQCGVGGVPAGLYDRDICSIPLLDSVLPLIPRETGSGRFAADTEFSSTTPMATRPTTRGFGKLSPVGASPDPVQYLRIRQHRKWSWPVCLFPLNVLSIPNKATWPYVQQWHFDVQHDVGWNTGRHAFLRGKQGYPSGPQVRTEPVAPVYQPRKTRSPRARVW